MSSKKTSPRISLLLEFYDQAFNKTAWHGPTLTGSLKGLKPVELLWRPTPERHNIWEIALHCAYWKYVVWRKLTGAKKGTFPRKPSDWPKLPSRSTLSEWKTDRELLLEWHAALREVIAGFPEVKLIEKPTGSKVTHISSIYGIASHDLYHAGQIQLIKRMLKSPKRESKS